MDIPESGRRVPESTAAEIDARILAEMEGRVRYYARHPEAIASRLDELAREWDIERALEANAAAFGLAGLTLGLRDRRALLLTGTVLAFLLQHAVQGWCPPLPLLRRMGLRTAREIEAERYALRLLAGEFDGARGDGEGAGERARVATATLDPWPTDTRSD